MLMEENDSIPIRGAEERIMLLKGDVSLISSEDVEDDNEMSEEEHTTGEECETVRAESQSDPSLTLHKHGMNGLSSSDDGRVRVLEE